MASHEELHTYLKQAVLELEKTRRRLREIEEKASEPIAIVGMACRYPGGVSSPADLWRAVSQGCDLVSGPPADRGWDLENTDGADSHIAGFVDEVTAFDADFFGISTREAAVMDPQQRLALEASWEAFERAGIDPAAAPADETGVFLGMASFVGTHSEGPVNGEQDSSLPFAFSGKASSMAAGRVSYFLGFNGPAITMDTACSSSLTAIHQAVQSLRSGECPLALAGGVTVMTPQRLSGLRGGVGSAADGRCKSFAASADGSGWGEGVGMLLLERLSDAQHNQHPVLAVIRGSAVNHDGSSNRAGAPNRLAQQRVIRRALANAGLDASQVDVVEAHSTGTPLGDLTEVEALIETYGRHRPEGRPLWLGSLKSNINHTLAAAGVGGVIKMVESMRHSVIPQTLHSGEPTPFVDWSSGGVALVTEAQPWPQRDDARRAGVSAFGISGVNAHVIVEEAPRQIATVGDAPEFSRDELPVFSWILSAKSEAALPMQAARLVAHLDENPGFDAADIGLSLATTRTQFTHRAVIVGRDNEELLAGLRSLAAGAASAEVVHGVAESSTKTAVMFPGEGAQSVGMGQQLYASFPQYAKVFDEVCSIFDELLGTSLQDVVFAEAGSEAAELLNQPAYAQPALFAFEVALYRLAESWGLRPDFVMGHSLGEVTAAYVAGVWSLADACELVAERGRLLQSIPVDESMLAVEATEGDVLPFLREFPGCSVVAIDSATSLTISGDHASLTRLAEKLEVNGMQTKRMGLSHPLHSANLEPLIPEFAAVCRRLTYQTPTIGVVSAVTGGILTADQLTTPQYWVDQLQQPAGFAEAVQWAQSNGGVGNFLEVGPGADLTARIDAESSNVTPLLWQTLEETSSFVSGLATLFVHGTSIDWSAGYADAGARRIELPTYAFQRRSLASAAPASAIVPASVAATPNSTIATTPKVHRSESREPLRTATERTLAAAIEQILGVSDVGRDERFVALGGDSVSAMQLAHRMHAANLPLNPQLIFEHPTLGELAAALDELAVETRDQAEQAGSVAGDGRFQAMSMSGLSAADLLALPDVLARIDKAAVA